MIVCLSATILTASAAAAPSLSLISPASSILKIVCLLFGIKAPNSGCSPIPSFAGVTRIITPSSAAARSDVYKALPACHRFMSAGKLPATTTSALSGMCTAHTRSAQITPAL
ncbi:MAG: hypothetical protein BWY85_01832 [Firmicutes bacterium ADurb.Bin506]|nr:MAG: hypothetical protein BWY85_01832 [Firmicutes bacterium ADurb.Bin506]